MKIVCFREEGAIAVGWLAADGQSVVRARDLSRFASFRDAKEVLDGLLCLRPQDRRRLAQSVGGSVPVDGLEILPPNPWAPAVWANHGNSSMVWKFQEARSRRWQLPRLPYFRLRPWNSLAGEGETVLLPEGAGFAHGVELAVVIGEPAREVDENAASLHIAGYTLLNDGFISGQFGAGPGSDPVWKQSMDTVAKAADRVTGLGPCIIGCEDVEDAYDWLLETRLNGLQQKRGWSGAYLLTAEYLIWTLSRSTTLQTGTVISLGACGWDGCKVPVEEEPGSAGELAVGGEHFGFLRSKVIRTCRKEIPSVVTFRKSWRSEVVSGTHRPCSVWLHRHVAGDDAAAPARPILYPSGVVRWSGDRLVIPASAGAMEVCLRPILRLTQRVFRHVPCGVLPGTVHVGLSARDIGFGDAILAPTPYEERGAWFLGGCGDGFLQVASSPAEWEGRYQLSAGDSSSGGLSRIETGPFEECLGILSAQATLFPGDLIGLAGWPHPVSLPPQSASFITWSYGSLSVRLAIHDARSSQTRDSEIRDSEIR